VTSDVRSKDVRSARNRRYGRGKEGEGEASRVSGRGVAMATATNKMAALPKTR
jgi:hypothetical protein